MRALFLTDRATNPTQYANPALDEAVLAGIDEVDPDTRQELSATAQQLLMDEAPAAWLYTTDQVVVVKKGVTGISAGDDLQTRLKFLSRTS
jgi:peptide/nickel transport system substrate-binding protein